MTSASEGGATTEAISAEPAIDYGTPTDTADVSTTPDARSYTVKVGGEELTVSEQELLSGYQRQSDYTRKTQELAAERQRLADAEKLVEAFQSDPYATLQALQDALGPNPADEVLLDPDEQRIRELEQWRAEQQQREVAAQVHQTYTQLAEKYNQYGDVTEMDLLQHAVERGIGDLDAAYKDLIWERAITSSTAQAQQQQADAEALDAKRAAAQLSGGHTPQAGVVGADRPGKVSIADAWRMAANSF